MSGGFNLTSLYPEISPRNVTEWFLKVQMDAKLVIRTILHVPCGWDIYQGYWGGLTSSGGSIYQGGKTLENGGFSRRRRRCEKFWALFLKFENFKLFFESFGKFVNKNAIKSDLWGVVGRYISKISKNPRFGGKIHLPTSKNFEMHLLKCRPAPPPTQKISLIFICHVIQFLPATVHSFIITYP